MSCASQPLISHFEVHRRRTRERASESAEGAQQPGARAAVIPSQTAAIKFSPHYLRQSHHRPVLGRGGEREERGWRLRVELGGGRHQSLSVCECVFLKDGGGALVRKIRHEYISLWHHVHTSADQAQAKLPGSLHRNQRLVMHRRLILN